MTQEDIKKIDYYFLVKAMSDSVELYNILGITNTGEALPMLSKWVTALDSLEGIVFNLRTVLETQEYIFTLNNKDNTLLISDEEASPNPFYKAVE